MPDRFTAEKICGGVHHGTEEEMENESKKNNGKVILGVGLSLVKAIMTNTNNKYGVENKENGVNFYFEVNLGNN